MGAFGLRSWIWNNAWKTALLLAGFPFLLVLICYAFALVIIAGDADGFGQGLVDAVGVLPWVLPPVAILTALWFGIAWLANQRIIDALSGARPVTRLAEPRLWNLLENLCISRGLGMPRLAVIETPARNAFASGLSRQTGAVTVTRGLLEALDDRELEAVLAHELTHIRNGDARLAVVAMVFAGVVSLPGELLFRAGRVGGRGFGFRSGRRSNDGKGGGGGALLLLLALAIVVLAYLLAIGLRFALSRNREFLADAGAVELTRDPDAMITALRKVAQQAALPALPSGLQAMLLESAEETLGKRWLATHPSLEERIAALVRFGGGKDLGPLPPPEAAPPAVPPSASPWASPWAPPD
jgi:heat shock protein HtpX